MPEVKKPPLTVGDLKKFIEEARLDDSASLYLILDKHPKARKVDVSDLMIDRDGLIICEYRWRD